MTRKKENFSKSKHWKHCCGICQGSQSKQLIIWKKINNNYMANKPERTSWRMNWFGVEHEQVTKCCVYRCTNRMLEGFFFFLQMSSINSLPNNKTLDWFKFKALGDDKMNLAEKQKFFLKLVENIAGKRENAGNQHFLLFPQCFQKASFSRLLKVRIVW